MGPHNKGKVEDLNSVLTGIMQPKGHVHHTTHFADHYSPALQKQFSQRLAAIPDAEKTILLGIYSHPVEQQYPTLI